MARRLNNSMRNAAFFIAGMVFGFGLFWVLVADDRTGTQIDTRVLSGSIAPIDLADKYKEIGSWPVKLDQVYGDVRLREADQSYVAEVTLSSLQEIHWVLTYDRDEVAFGGFSQVEGQVGDIEVKSGELDVSHVGRGRYLVFFTGQVDDPKPLEIEISMAGRVIYELGLTDGGSNQ